MAFLPVSLSMPAYTSTMAMLTPSCLPSTSSLSAISSVTVSSLPPLNSFSRTAASIWTQGSRKSWIVRMAPEEEQITLRHPLGFPTEWERPKAPRRPDIFPQFRPMKTPLPLPMPGDPPPQEDEYEEDEEDEEYEEYEKQEEEGEEQIGLCR